MDQNHLCRHHKLDVVEAAITADTKVLCCETVSNPLLEVADIAGLSKIAKKKHNLKLVVDNTFLHYQ
jgi:methionine-gamma-lyase